MREIISSIDIGSGNIKLVVGEFIKDKFYILATTKIGNSGIKNGIISEPEIVSNNIKKAIQNVSRSLGIQINKVILGVDSFDTKLIKTASAIKITNEDSTIKGKDVANVIQNCAAGKIPNGYVLVGVIPVEFTIDNDEILYDPKGVKSDNLGLKAIIVASPKGYISSMLQILYNSGLKVVDVIPSCIGDYYTFKTEESNKRTGLIINFGNEKITLSLFNRGILTNTKVLNLGANNIITELVKELHINKGNARAIYADMGLASTAFANPNEYRIISNLENQNIKLNQYIVSEIISRELENILRITKKIGNTLTNKELSYIIITGGLTELRDFNLAIENVYGKNIEISKLTQIGVRDNSYSSAVGILKFFDYKIKLRDKKFSILSANEINEMNNTGNKTSVNSDSLLSKVFGYFFDN